VIGETLNWIRLLRTQGLVLSQWLKAPSLQEVAAATAAVKRCIPDTDVVIELGGGTRRSLLPAAALSSACAAPARSLVR
jgi:hypothetical protein